MTPKIDKSQFRLNRVGVVMTADEDDRYESWGVLNPASARSASENLWLYPRIVAEGNYSRIGRAKVEFASNGDPVGVVRDGFALEPSEPYEGEERTPGGVEDPRVTYVAELKVYVMTYVGLGRLGPRIALAISEDCKTWRRLGLLQFEVEMGVDFGRYGNKDAVVFPSTVRDREGRECFAILHRPTYLVHNDDGTIERVIPPGVEDERPGIWLSFISAKGVREDIRRCVKVHDTMALAAPREKWEVLKIGAGPPPILTEDGWVLYYHGVSGREDDPTHPQKDVCYQAGVMVLDPENPARILYRSACPVFSPDHLSEQEGIVPNVVFPTAIDVRDQRIDVYYGAADIRIGVASTVLSSRILLAASSPTTTIRAGTP